jgi:CheY-like chemotaxis protein
MKKLNIAQLLALCNDVEVDNRQQLTQTLLATLEQLAVGAARKLGVAACGVERSRYGVHVAFSPLAPGDPCPPLLQACDDEGVWHEPPQRTLLICDDDRNQTLLARHAVSNLGIRVIETHSAEEAWRAYQLNEVNLVITDIVLPGQDGFELLGKIVAHEARKGNRRKVPVITISGDAATEIGCERVDRAGVVAHLKKPVDWGQLGPVIGELCHAV